MSKALTRSLLMGAVVSATAALGFSQKLDFQATGVTLQAAPADPQIAAALGAVSVETIHRNIQTLVDFGTRNTLSSMVTGLPPGKGINPAAGWIEAQFDAYSKECGGCLEVKEDAFMQEPPAGGAKAGSRVLQPTRMTNVYAILRGTDPAQAKRMYLVTGHYDTRASDVMDAKIDAPGANDDTSGTAVSMECARVLSKHKFPATILFVTVPGEEQGLLGSKHLAELARSEGWELQGVLNNDIVGGNTTPGETLQNKNLVRVFSEGISSALSNEEMRRLLFLGAESDSPSRELAREILDTARTYLPTPALRPVMELRLDRYGRGGDHRSFNEEGFAAVRFTEWREDYNHQHQTVRRESGVQYGDLLQYDDFNYIARVTKLNAATLATMASAPGQPKDVHISTREQANTSVIDFDAPDGAPPDTWYQLVWRETAAANWQYGGKASVYQERVEGAKHTVTVPISKDNVFFGVRSCDAREHCSAAVAPVPPAQLR
jgi:hypothetical protein